MKFHRPPLLAWLAWLLLTTIATAVIPIQMRLGSIWSAETSALTVGGGLALAYLLSNLVLAARTWNTTDARVFEIVGIQSFFVACVFLLVLLSESVYSRSVLLLSLLLAGGFTLLPLVLTRRLQTVASLALAAILLTLPFVRTPIALPGLRQPDGGHRIVRSSFYNLIATSYRNVVGPQEVTGGGLAQFGDRVLLAKGDGSLYLFWWEGGEGQLQSRRLPYQVPLNRQEFVRDTATVERVNPGFFRTAAIVVQDLGERFRLFASHHYWDQRNRCFTVRVSSLSGNSSAFLEGRERESWETVYESAPCLRFKNKGNPFAGYQIGGRLALWSDRELLVALGDHEFDGEESVETVSQNAAASYGKTILVNLVDRTSSIYTVGHRNPQGLHVDGQRNIWLAEHGPKGGDELNLISAGLNYGWPVVTYGTAYTHPEWPFNPVQNRHDGFQQPAFTWIPSIGISSIVRLKGDRLKIWKDDVLAGSLVAKALWRIRVHDRRVVFVEKLAIGERIRDLIETRDGRLLLWTEGSIEPPTDAGLVVIEPATDGAGIAKLTDPTERGALLFARCAGCHPMEDAAGHGIGPSLVGVMQRRIASAPGYTYSAGLRRKGGAWTEQNLDAFLTDPQRFAPGTTMQSGGVASSGEREDLIEYLKSLRQE